MSLSLSSTREEPRKKAASLPSASTHDEPNHMTIPTTSPQSSHPVSPAEAKKIATMESKIAALEVKIKETKEKQVEIDRKLKSKDPQATVRGHITLLHDYNEIRDVGQGLMGIIADNTGVRVSDVYRDFDVGEGD